MQDPPRVDHIGARQLLEKRLIQHRTMKNLPRLGNRQARFQGLGGGHTVRIHINAGHGRRAQGQRRRRKQATAAANIEKVLSVQVFHLQQVDQRGAGGG